MPPRRPRPRTFVYRGGVRIAETVVACDAATGSDLAFVSHASRLASHRRRGVPALGSGRRQLLATELTLTLLGAVGQRLRAHALVAAYGRPFGLGDLRLELFPSGFMPGAASLLCERQGRRIVYSGPLGPGPLATRPDRAEADPGDDGGAVSLRAADALCLDATFACASAPPVSSRSEAVAAVCAEVRVRLAAGQAPVVMVDSAVPVVSIANGLHADGVTLRGHREIVQTVAAYRAAGLRASAVDRFAGRLGSGEVLIWPAAAVAPPRRAGARPYAPLLVSSRLSAEAPAVVSYPVGAHFETLLRYVEATGASEVAVVNASGTELVEALASRGIDAYILGPPRQIQLFAADAA